MRTNFREPGFSIGLGQRGADGRRSLSHKYHVGRDGKASTYGHLVDAGSASVLLSQSLAQALFLLQLQVINLLLQSSVLNRHIAALSGHEEKPPIFLSSKKKGQRVQGQYTSLSTVGYC